MEKCANCHRNIGDLEQVFVAGDQPVCTECYKRLTLMPVGTPANRVATDNDAALLLAGAVLRGAGVVVALAGALGFIAGMLPARPDSYGYTHPSPSSETGFLIFVVGVALFGGGSWMIKTGRETK